MPDANLNARWGRCLAEELKRAGCAGVVGCPGSRNSPLLFALAAVFGERLHTHWDERGAGFYALGMAKALRASVAVCVTSGTAAANLLPAVCEADAAGVPLVLLTADRPDELQDCGAPQTMRQSGLFGAFADELALGEPTAEPAHLRALRRTVVRAVAAARRPLHLNLPLRDPLPPLAEGWQGPEDDGAFPPPTVPAAPPPPPAPEMALGHPARGLIVAGSAEAVPRELVAGLAAATGFPVLADAGSGLRRPAVPHLAICPDALYAKPPAEPEVIIRIGAPPLTRAGYEWLGRQRCPQIVLGGPRQDDFLHTASVRIVDPDTAAVARLIAALGRADDAWRALWRSRTPKPQGWNATRACAVACAATGFDLLWLASSMPVRDANLVLAPATWRQRVLSNRGLNGIDGTVASFLGACRATAARGLCLLGDLACLHDLNSLALTDGLDAALVVLNNGGGGIFDFLPVSRVPGWRRLVRTDHGLGFASAAAQFGLAYQRCAAPAELAEALAGSGPRLIECDLHGTDAVGPHRAALASAQP